MSTDEPAQKLSIFTAKFIAASEAHEEAEALAEHAIELEEIVREAMRASGALKAGQYQ